MEYSFFKYKRKHLCQLLRNKSQEIRNLNKAISKKDKQVLDYKLKLQPIKEMQEALRQRDAEIAALETDIHRLHKYIIENGDNPKPFDRKEFLKTPYIFS